MCCSSRGSEFSYKHPYQVANNNLQFQLQRLHHTLFGQPWAPIAMRAYASPPHTKAVKNLAEDIMPGITEVNQSWALGAGTEYHPAQVGLYNRAYTATHSLMRLFAVLCLHPKGTFD